MNKKANTIVFMLVGTVVSVVITLLLMFLLVVLVLKLFPEKPEVFGNALPIIVLAAMILGAVIYQFGAKFVIKKFNMEDKLEPIFGGKHQRSKLD